MKASPPPGTMKRTIIRLITSSYQIAWKRRTRTSPRSGRAWKSWACSREKVSIPPRYAPAERAAGGKLKSTGLEKRKSDKSSSRELAQFAQCFAGKIAELRRWRRRGGHLREKWSRKKFVALRQFYLELLNINVECWIRHELRKWDFYKLFSIIH